MILFKEKVKKIVSKIPPGKFLSYKKVAKLVGKPQAFRAIANILAKNTDPEIFCHRVIRNDNLIGGFAGQKKLAWKKAAFLLKEGAIGVIPTDTIYGICGSALNKKTVEKIYKLRQRNPKKPFIILIKELSDLKIFKVPLSQRQKNFLLKIWPGPISIILKCPSKKFNYLHRETKTLAFRMPKNKILNDILKISGPLVAPSANIEGYSPAKTIKEAKKYFKDKVFYLEKPKQTQSSKNFKILPSTLIDFTSKKPVVLRRGKGFSLLKEILLNYF